MILVAVWQGAGRTCHLRDHRIAHAAVRLLRQEPLLEAKALGLTGRWFTGAPAVSERHALPVRSPDRDFKLARMVVAGLRRDRSSRKLLWKGAVAGEGSRLGRSLDPAY